MSREKVPEQRGPINPSPRTSKTTPQFEKLIERAGEQQTLRRNMTMDLHEPKARK